MRLSEVAIFGVVLLLMAVFEFLPQFPVACEEPSCNSLPSVAWTEERFDYIIKLR